MNNLLIGALISYLIGSIPTSYIFGKLFFKIDLRKHGSGNLGATNVFRTLGKSWGVLTMILDILKGWICVTFVADYFYATNIGYESSKVLFGVLVVIGHVYPVFLKFKGGKGVATSTGVLLGINFFATLIVASVFFLVVFFTRYISLGSIIAALILPATMYALDKSKLYLIVSMVLSVLVILKHKPNIKRLVLGTENKIVFSKNKK